MAETINNIKDFKSLEVFDKIRLLIKDIYRIMEQFPPCEKYCATSQIRRAATSIGANIAEGNGQLYPSKELNFLNNALGSLSETRYWLEFARDQDFIPQAEYNQLDTLCI